MRKIILFIFCLLFFKLAYSLSPDKMNSLVLSNTNTELTLNRNYQQFKYQIVNLESDQLIDYANFKRRRKKRDDKLMLYVAGGIALATATLILTNNPDNFTSNSASGVNLGIAAGGTVACGMIVAKYFIDKRR